MGKIIERMSRVYSEEERVEGLETDISERPKSIFRFASTVTSIYECKVIHWKRRCRYDWELHYERGDRQDRLKEWPFRNKEIQKLGSGSSFFERKANEKKEKTKPVTGRAQEPKVKTTIFLHPIHSLAVSVNFSL